VPSGLDATTGVRSNCVIADLTLSFGGVKRGLLLARDCCGKIVALDIGLDDPRPTGVSKNATPELALPILVDGEWVESRIPPIRFDAHKGIRKHLGLVGGGKGMPGAVVLAARAALRSGIGLLRILTAPENVSAVLSAVPSALISEWPSAENHIESDLSKWADAIVIGPGLGKSKETRSLVERILGDSKVPVVLDADALNVFEGDKAALGKLLNGRAALITPHPAEFARLAGIDVKTVLAARFDIGLDLARELEATVLLKGAPTVVFDSTGNCERHSRARNRWQRGSPRRYCGNDSGAGARRDPRRMLRRVGAWPRGRILRVRTRHQPGRCCLCSSARME
jgi:NAD(P)H-hydrate epimerase